MVFSSVLFLFRFLPVFFICYYVAPGRMKNFILLLGSLIFYAWGEPVYILLMLFSTLSDYVHGRLIEKYRGGGRAKLFLVSSVLINLLVLCFFKYADFLIQTVNVLFGTSIPPLNLPLPIGISFYTFQTMSYTIDVYRGEAEVQRNLLDFGVFVTMFPQLIAGPIVKYRDVEERLHNRSVDICTVSCGMKRFCVGLAKKVLIANNIGELWSEISGMNLGEISALTAWLGILAFAFQIYFDFSGYSDMAIGLGKMMGFYFPENFNYPYISASVTEFWRRWHISLGSWFREYVYIPLGGNRKGLPRQLVNIFIVWMLTGIWHGAGWNFLLWGLYYLLFLMMEKFVLGHRMEQIPGLLRRGYLLLVVALGWLIFRVTDLSCLVTAFRGLFGGNGNPLTDYVTQLELQNHVFFLLAALLACTPLVRNLYRRIDRAVDGMPILQKPWTVLQCVVPVLLLILSTAALVGDQYNPFLYYRF